MINLIQTILHPFRSMEQPFRNFKRTDWSTAVQYNKTREELKFDKKNQRVENLKNLEYVLKKHYEDKPLSDGSRLNFKIGDTPLGSNDCVNIYNSFDDYGYIIPVRQGYVILSSIEGYNEFRISETDLLNVINKLFAK